MSADKKVVPYQFLKAKKTIHLHYMLIRVQSIFKLKKKIEQ